MVLTWLLACGPDAPVSDSPVEGVDVDPVVLATRASVDLRGVRPSAEEYARVDAGEVDTLLAEWLEDPRFGDQVGSVYADVLLTRADAFLTTGDAYGLDAEAPFIQAVGRQPVEMVAEIARGDLPWTEAVTGDWTMADETLASVWPLERDGDGAGWQRARWTDARPAAGILATNGLYWRFPSTESNANRGRASQVARAFLCTDYASRLIPFDRSVDLSDEEAVRAALAENPSCVTCHSALDPLAASLFGFWYRFDENPWEAARYHHDREVLWADYLDTAPAFYGTPITGFAELGPAIAADPRFPGCAVETVYRALLARPIEVEDTDALVRHRDAFIADDARFRALYRSILADPAYAEAPAHLASPDQLASMVEGLTGYRLSRDGWDLLRTDTLGYRLLAGGLDGVDATARVTLPTPTLLLVQERLAEAAASHGVDTGRLGSTAMPTAATVAPVVRAVTGERWDDATLASFLSLADGLPPRDAWVVLVAALLRDPAFLSY